MDLVGCHREQDLPRAAQFAEAGEDETDRFLEPQLWIKAKANVAMPDVADRNADAQLATPRLGAGGGEMRAQPS